MGYISPEDIDTIGISLSKNKSRNSLILYIVFLIYFIVGIYIIGISIFY